MNAGNIKDMIRGILALQLMTYAAWMSDQSSVIGVSAHIVRVLRFEGALVLVVMAFIIGAWLVLHASTKRFARDVYRVLLVTVFFYTVVSVMYVFWARQQGVSVTLAAAGLNILISIWSIFAVEMGVAFGRANHRRGN